MGSVNAYLQTFAGGEFGDAMSARVSIDAYQASSELAENFFFRAQGPMFRRPSLSFIDQFVDSTKKGVLRAFEFDVGQNYLLKLIENRIDFYLNDALLETDEVSAFVSNGNFGNFVGWTDASESGSSADAVGGYLQLVSNGPAAAVARTTISIVEANKVHILAFDIAEGPVSVRVGPTAGSDAYMVASSLRRGHHRIEFTPTATGNCVIQFNYSGAIAVKLVDNVQILAGPDFSVPSPWLEADLKEVLTAQDGDRLYMFHRDYPPRVLERRGNRSWSLIYFEPDDGPWEPGMPTVQLTPASRFGQTTISSSTALFKSTDVRRLVRITHSGQYTSRNVNKAGVYGDPIKVSGIGHDRIFGVIITGTWSGTITLERSNGNKNDFSKVITFTGNINTTYNDSYPASDTAVGGASDTVYTASQSNDAKGRLDNTTCYYRLSVRPGEWTSGTAFIEIYVESGSQTGVARIIGYLSTTSVTVNVIKPFSKAFGTDVWDMSPWNDEDEYPNVNAFAHGRFWTARRRQLWSSAPDDYFSFQDGVEADNGVNITLRSRSAEGIRWMRELDFLCAGTRNEEYVIRSTSPNEAIGPTTIEPTLQGEEGGASVPAEVGGDSIVYVHRDRRRVMQFTHNPKALSEDSFVSVDLNRLNPEATQVGIVNAVIQQQPERRIFVTLEDGKVRPALFKREEDIMAWSTMSTQGIIEDSLVLREDDQDSTYFLIRRKIGDSWIRMIEKLSSEVTLNPEDRVHLDCMLETTISRPAVGITPSALEGAVTVEAVEDAFSSGDIGKVLWVDGGRISVTGFTNARLISGTVAFPLIGEQDAVTGDYMPRFIPGGLWGLTTAVSSVSGLDHLEGMTVQIWADMAYAGEAVVSSGQVPLPYSASRVFVGLPFRSIWKSLKLAYGANKGTAINQPKAVHTLGFLLDDASDTLYIGDTPGKLKPLVKLQQNAVLGGAPRLFSGEAYEKFDGRFSTDPRIILATVNPGPVTIKALIPHVSVNER